jgi:hypothetical protein
MVQCTIERAPACESKPTLREVLSVLGNALATAAAIRQGTEPKARNLRGLGIDPSEFRKINHYH